jgi:2'-5' RNA ligase
MLRLFVGIGLPPEQKLALSIPCAGVPGVRWVDPGNYHVTLRFVGEVDEGSAEDIDEALAGLKARPFSLAIAGLGLFGPDDRPRMIYAALDPCPALHALHERVEITLMRLGFMPEGRRYTPHVTLGRAVSARPESLRAFVAANNLLRLAPFPVDAFQLIRSYLTKAGSIYEDVAEYRLR